MSRKKTNKTNPHIGGELAVGLELRVTALDAPPAGLACKTKMALLPKRRRDFSAGWRREFEHGRRNGSARLIRVCGYDPVAIW